MSLYIRLLNGFYTHRKTLRLRAAIGDAAFWVPPRLWSYASENQPDGCFKQYSAPELALLVAYDGDAQALLIALLAAGFMDTDPLRIHDWEEHNGYHVLFAERAKKAAAARWDRTRKTILPPIPHEKTVQDKIVQEASIAQSNASSIPNGALVSNCQELLNILGSALYQRPSAQWATDPEQRAALDVLKRPNCKAEVEAILSFSHRLLPGDRKYQMPQSLSRLLSDWSETLDKARNYNPQISDGRPPKPTEFHVWRDGRWMDKRHIGPNI